MATRVLAPMDGSALADRITIELVELLVPAGLDLHLLTIVEHERLAGDARVHLEDVARRVKALGAAATVCVAVGEAHASEIVRFAERCSADLVALATHGRRAFARWFQPSVAEELIRRARSDVLIAGCRWLHDPSSGPRRLRRIVVPLDGSESSISVLPRVEALARAHDAEVLLLNVEFVPLVVPWTGEDAFAPPPDVQHRLDPHVRALQRVGITARALAAYGPTAETINAVAEGEQADLIAMGTHARTGLSHALKGSITEQVLRGSARPLLVSACRR